LPALPDRRCGDALLRRVLRHDRLPRSRVVERPRRWIEHVLLPRNLDMLIVRTRGRRRLPRTYRDKLPPILRLLPRIQPVRAADRLRGLRRRRLARTNRDKAPIAILALLP